MAETDSPRSEPTPRKRDVGIVTAAMLVSVAVSTVALLSSCLFSGIDSKRYPLLLPVWLFMAAGYFLLARRGALWTVPVAAMLAGGAVLGSVLSLAPHAMYHRFAGLWATPILVTTRIEWSQIAATALLRGFPHLLTAGLIAWVVVRGRGWLSEFLWGAFAGLAAGALELVGHAAFGVSLPALPTLGTALTTYAVFVPILAWTGDQMHPYAERSGRRVRPLLVIVWVLPLMVLPLCGWLAGRAWLGGNYASGLLPVLVVLDLYREIETGLSSPNILQSSAICIIFFALAIGLCSSLRWAWLPWTIWLLHDAVCLAAIAWLASSVLRNVRALGSVATDMSAPLNSWGFFTILSGLAVLFALRVWCLTRRGVRPT